METPCHVTRIPEDDTTATNRGLMVEIIKTQVKFDRACNQVRLLNRKLLYLKRRCDLVPETDTRGPGSCHYHLMLRVSSLEGVRNMFLEYAQRTAETLMDLKRELFTVAIDDYNSEDDWTDVEDFEPITEHEDDI